MANAAMMGWDADAKVWRKLVCNAAGKLIIDPSEILEDPPTAGEAGKAATSNWSHDHAANASAHHARYTDAEAVSSWKNRLATLTAGTYKNYDVTNISFLDLDTTGGGIYLKGLSGGTKGHIIICLKTNYLNNVYIYNGDSGVPASDRIYLTSGSTEQIWSYLRQGFILIHTGSFWQCISHLFCQKSEFFEDSPSNGVTNKGPTSNWAFDHNANAAAHHARYTDAEARAAVGYNGTKYWSCAGIHFDATVPDSDVISKTYYGYLTIVGVKISLVAHVALPNGAVITECVVRGNAGASSKTWALRRIDLTDAEDDEMATAMVNTATTTIYYPGVDNSQKGYLLYIKDLVASDIIYGATITYTL